MPAGHEDIVRRAYEGFVGFWNGAHAGPEADIVEFTVPGAFELPLHAMKLAESGAFDAIVCAGFVVDGGIYRHEFVAETVVGALMRVQLDKGIPAFSVVLTPHHYHGHAQHHAFYRDHFVEKGREAAQACAQTLCGLERIERMRAPGP